MESIGWRIRLKKLAIVLQRYKLEFSRYSYSPWNNHLGSPQLNHSASADRDDHEPTSDESTICPAATVQSRVTWLTHVATETLFYTELGKSWQSHAGVPLPDFGSRFGENDED
ncbi:hypothetical protein BST61_g3941 [Cercospora zeina]